MRMCRSPGHIGFALLVLDYTTMASSLSTRSSARPSPATFVLERLGLRSRLSSLKKPYTHLDRNKETYDLSDICLLSTALLTS